MKKTIDALIKKHTEGYQKYHLKLSISDFKTLQRLMANEYHIKDYNGYNSMWRYKLPDSSWVRTGTIKFDNFELNVSCPSLYKDDFVFKAVDEVDKKIFKNSK